MDIVCLGELVLDMFASEGGKDFFNVSAFIPVAGGAPANVAVAAARLGARSAFIGKVGEDQFGRRLEALLKGYQVDTRGLRFDPQHRTTLNFMTLPDPNRTEMLFYRNPGADMLLSPDELDLPLLANTAAYHFGSVSLSVEPCRSAALQGARCARDAGGLVSFDMNYRAQLWESESRAVREATAALPMVDILKVNETELKLLTRTDDAVAGCTRIVQQGPMLAVATLGPDGCAWATRRSSGRVPGYAVEIVDATGCGDAFMAALLTRLLVATGNRAGERLTRLAALEAEALASTLLWANAAGALTALRKGVMPALPDANEVNAMASGL
jgi:fructokinase